MNASAEDCSIGTARANMAVRDRKFETLAHDARPLCDYLAPNDQLVKKARIKQIDSPPNVGLSRLPLLSTIHDGIVIYVDSELILKHAQFSADELQLIDRIGHL